MTAVQQPIARLRTGLSDPLIRNSTIMLATTLIMAVVGSVFWIVAARVATSAEVGLASSLVTSTEALAVFAQLGVNVTLIRTMPRSDRQASDVLVAAVVVSAFAGVLALAYSSLLPAIAPDLADIVSWPFAAPLFAVLVAGTALNQLTDGMFLSIDRVVNNLQVNGILMSFVKLGLPFLFAGAGAFGVYSAVGGAAAVAAAASMFVILRVLPGRPTLRPSQEFRRSSRFTGAGYASSVLYFTPQLVFPVLIINAQGPAQSAIYFISFQIVTLLNQGVYAVSNSMYAEVSRAPEKAQLIVAKAGRTIGIASVVGIAILVVVAPLLLGVFGSEYAEGGVTTLRVLALGTLGVAFNYWSSVRLRIAQHLQAMVIVQLGTTVLMIGLAAVLAPVGIQAVALAWGLGQFAGGVVGYVVSRTIAPMPVVGPPVREARHRRPRPQPRPQPRSRPLPRHAKEHADV